MRQMIYLFQMLFFFRVKGSFSLQTYILTITSEYELEWEIFFSNIWTSPQRF